MQDVVMEDSDRLSVLREALRRRLGAERCDLWLGGRTRMAFTGETLRIACASPVELQWLRRRLQAPLAECCAALWSAPVEIVFEELPAAPTTVARAEDATASRPEKPSTPRAPVETNCRPSSAPPMTPRHTFDNFTIGPCNHLAAQAARDLAQQPGRFTPLLLHGPPGCGKTHLLYAIEHVARSARGRIRCVALTAEQFTSQFLDALNRRALPGFRQKTRSVDLLLIDDVQFFDNKKATLEELLYTIDALHSRGGQAALASDCTLADLHPMSPELACRISAGLTVALELPDCATRAGIFRTMALRANVKLEDQVVELVARQIVGSARLLSGALNRLLAASMAAKRPITSEITETVLADFCRQHAPQVRLADIQRAVCDVFGVESATLLSPRKNRAAAEPRMLAMWLARRYTRAALSEIGDFFGGRSHSTVVSAKRKLDGLISRGGEMIVGDHACPVEEAVRRVEARLRTG
jgi:chromosomal replication initiator protein